jgi:uncharacterized protein
MSAIFKPATSPDTLFIDADDRINNLSDNGHFDNVLHARLGRRALFKSALGTGASAILGSIALSACGGGGDAPVPAAAGAAPAPAPAPAPAAQKLLGFNAVAKNLTDTVTVAAGYTWLPTKTTVPTAIWSCAAEIAMTVSNTTA